MRYCVSFVDTITRWLVLSFLFYNFPITWNINHGGWIRSLAKYRRVSWFVNQIKTITRFIYKQHSFSTQYQIVLTFSWIEFQMLLGVTWSIFILKHFLHLLYLCPCLDLGLFMSYLCDLFFIFIFIFIKINHIIPRK